LLADADGVPSVGEVVMARLVVDAAAGKVTAPAVLTGPVVSEVRSVVGSGWLTQVTRLWAGAAWAEIEYTVGPIPAGAKGTGKEVVTRFAAPALATAGAWATDSNCREMVPRTRDRRYSWNYTVYEPIAGNYVPLNCRITTKGTGPTDPTLSITLDRSQGGGSMVGGREGAGGVVARRLLARLAIKLGGFSTPYIAWHVYASKGHSSVIGQAKECGREIENGVEVNIGGEMFTMSDLYGRLAAEVCAASAPAAQVEASK
jgi:hypothetical protein